MVWKKSGVKPPALENNLPDWLSYLWRWFLELHQTRGVGVSSMMPITYAEIDAWSKLTGNSPTEWEVRAIKAVDAVACKPRDK